MSVSSDRFADRSGGDAWPAGGTRRNRDPVAIGALMPRITRPAFAKYGFPAAALFIEWETIVGASFAAFTRPERIKWPRRPEEEVEVARQSGQYGRRSGTTAVPAAATLVLRVDGPRALEVQLQGMQLLERINRHFGYRAIGELRILQAPLIVSDKQQAARPNRPKQSVDVDLSVVADAGLRAALERLRAGVAGVARPAMCGEG